MLLSKKPKHIIGYLATLESHTSWVRSAEFSKGEDKLRTGSSDNAAKIWKVLTGECLTTLWGHTMDFTSAEFYKDQDKALIASWYDRTTMMLCAQAGKCLQTQEVRTGWILSAVFSKGGDMVLSTLMDKTAKIWNISPSKQKMAMFSQVGQVTLHQALILDTIYELIVCRRLAILRLKKLSRDLAQEVDLSRYVLDFNDYSHLQSDYEKLPQVIRNKLVTYVRKVPPKNNCLTVSTANESDFALALSSEEPWN